MKCARNFLVLSFLIPASLFGAPPEQFIRMDKNSFKELTISNGCYLEKKRFIPAVNIDMRVDDKVYRFQLPNHSSSTSHEHCDGAVEMAKTLEWPQYATDWAFSIEAVQKGEAEPFDGGLNGVPVAWVKRIGVGLVSPRQTFPAGVLPVGYIMLESFVTRRVKAE